LSRQSLTIARKVALNKRRVANRAKTPSSANAYRSGETRLPLHSSEANMLQLLRFIWRLVTGRAFKDEVRGWAGRVD